MALSDLWTAAQIESAIRRELMDPTGTTAWSWNSAELQQYISDWQNILQDRFEFAWGSSTVVSSGTATVIHGTATDTTQGTSTFTITAISTSILRAGNAWWNGYRLVGRTIDELDTLQRDWRMARAGTPQALYQNDINTISVWPAPAATTTNTLVMEYPKIVSFPLTSTPISVPAWTRYSALSYALFRCYQRPGPQQDLARAERYKQRFVRQGIRIRTIWDAHFPDKAPSLRFLTQYEGDILNVGMHNTLFQSWF